MGLREVVGDAVKEASQWLTRRVRRPSKTPASQHRYPPVVDGIPALPVAEILAQQEDLLAQTRHLVEEISDWERWYVPIIERFADFVHLLPASEAHHHRGVGGLLTHSLEVGLYVMQEAYGKLYGLKLEPKDRREARHRWLLASYVGGLCHDLGKPLAVMRVTSPDGKVWEPYSSNILAWCRAHRMKKYFVSFKKRRQEDHEMLAMMALDRVLTTADREYLAACDPDLMLDVLLTIQDNSKAGHEMHAMMKKADNQSVQDDLANSNLAQDLGPRVGLPTMQILLTTMRRLVAEGQWEINKPGGPLWHLADSLFMVWPKGGQDIVAMLGLDKAYAGVPRDHTTMLAVMLEWRFAEMTPASTFWLLYLGGQAEPLRAIKIRELQTLVDLVPAPAAGTVEAEKPEPEMENQLVGLAESATVPHEPQPEGAAPPAERPVAEEKAAPEERSAEVVAESKAEIPAETVAEPEPLVVEPLPPRIVVEIPEERLALLREQVTEIMSAWEIK